MALDRFDPYRESLSLRDAMTRLVEQSVLRPGSPAGASMTAPLDVYTDGDDYVVELALPGLPPEAVNIAAMGNQVTISGEYPSPPEGRRYLVCEQPSGRFERTITLPAEADPDKATADYQHGLLRLQVPKAESAKPWRITLKSG